MSTVTVLGTARPWNFFGNGVNNPGAANTNVGMNAGFNDGSNAGGVTGQNVNFRFGQQHVSPAGETAPSILFGYQAGDTIVLTYTSGTVATQAGGAGNSTPAGSASTIPATPTTTDNNGYVYPSDYITGCTTTIGGLLGAFTDDNDNIISLWDWKSSGGTATPGSSITLVVPVGATRLSLGIHDTILRDNTGSFTMTLSTTITGAGAGVAAGNSTAPSFTSGDSLKCLPVSTKSIFLNPSTAAGNATKRESVGNKMGVLN